jgi:lipid-binding SYLF domain-containing protein
MISGSAARIASNTSTGSLSYIDSLVTGATAQGLYSITVEGSKINSAMITTLTNYGYTVNTFYDTMGTFPRYIISW